MTGVEFLEKQLTLALGDEVKDLQGLFVIAKEMREKEIKDAYERGQNTGWSYGNGDSSVKLITGKDYYEQTFNKESNS